LRRKLRVIFSMPELPEVETVRRSVENAVVGARITQVEVGRERTVRRSSKQALIAGLHQETIVAVRRHGKYLPHPGTLAKNTHM
jgi:formamidopyrimidine-DNA glycosylase